MRAASMHSLSDSSCREDKPKVVKWCSQSPAGTGWPTVPYKPRALGVSSATGKRSAEGRLEGFNYRDSAGEPFVETLGGACRLL